MGVMENLDEFCKPVSLFWWRDGITYCTFRGPRIINKTLALNATVCHDGVDLSVCFEDSAVLYAICIFLWVFAGLEFLLGRNSIKPRIYFNLLHALKLILLSVPLVTAFCDLIYTIVEQHDLAAKFEYLSPAVLVMTMLVAALLLHHERKLGIRSSAVLFIFWMCMSIYGSFKLRTLILMAEDDNYVRDKFRFTTFCFQYATYLLQFILTIFPEPRSKLAYQDLAERKPCPEEDASFLSYITWWWLNGLIWRGWRHSLEYSDLTDLNYDDKSRAIAPRFQRNWDKQIRKAGVTYGRVQLEEEEYQPINTMVSEDVRMVTARPRKQKEPSLVVALARSFGETFVVAAFFKLGSDLLGFASPFILKLMIAFTKDKSEPDWNGYFYAVLLFVAAVIQSLFLHQYFHRCFRVGMRIRTAIIAAVYKKALKLNNRARRTSTVGEIVNLMSVDAQRFMDLMTYFHMIWSAPLQIVLALGFLYMTMGPSIFAGFAVMILLIPLNAFIAAQSRRYQVRQMIQKDSRIKLVNEVLNGIKVIKLYAWEIPFQSQIMGIRKSELDVLKASAYLNAAASFTWTCAPFLVSLATFATYALVNINSETNRLTADKVFVALSLFNILRFPLTMLPMLISNIVQASVSVKRLRHFLKNEELDPTTVLRRPEHARGDEDAVSVVNGQFTWETEETQKATLSDLNLQIKPGHLVAVVGHVGAGKSSLIQALLGEMDKISGNVSLKGRIAYVPQQAWIQNATLKDNILFGKRIRGVLYGKTIQACALDPDLEILPGGDMTEIGEKGINLSGGQKQRVSLARAVYQEADIYLLDDPLSAVDSHVGKHIFEKVIGPDGMLKGKTRILVTHGIGFLPQCDQIVVMNDGKVTEVGSYTELIDNNGAFADFLRTYANVEENEEGDPLMSEYSEYEDETIEAPVDDPTAHTTPGLTDDAETHARQQARKIYLERQRSRESTGKPEVKRYSSRTELRRQLSKQASKASIGDREKSPPATETTTLITEEKVETGTVKLSVLITYCKACSYFLSFLTILFFVCMNGASIASNFWLADWSNSEDATLGLNLSNMTYNHTTACDGANGPEVGCYLGIYGALGISQSFFVLFGSFSLAIGGILASKTLHNKMLANILRSPMSFFDTTPLGRILNRFSKDIYLIDEVVPRSIRMFIWTFLSVLSTIIVIVIATPIFAVVIVPLGIFYILVQRFYVATSRQLKRLESTTRSPIYSHFQESILGAASIRAYQQQERFVLESERKVDYNQMAYYPSVCANRWLAIRLEFVGNLIILFAALFAAIQRNFQGELSLNISPGLVGLSISYALQVTQTLNWMVRMTSELETNIVSVERTKEYSETPTEAPAIIDSRRPPQDWPSDGGIKFDRYSTRYRPGLDLVLRDISVDIPGGTKVGIVGRTGAGKSSLTVAMFRIVEAASGGILVDNINIAVFGLDDLRSRLTIIPQDPVLFSGTLRVNLDPFESYEDEDVWRALESAHLSNFVSGLTEKLEYPIAEGGENLSVGQRQLVCLARALLRKSKILVLDEATAAVDLETDDLIQKTIRTEFANCTILTIAHRLNTILDYDHVMVLDAGRIIEYDTPTDLLDNKKSTFYSMAKDAGLVA